MGDRIPDWRERERARRREERADRLARRPTDEQVLDALAGLAPADGTDYAVDADAVYRRLKDQGFYATVVGAGRRLTRLAREGRCEVIYDFSNRYRARPEDVARVVEEHEETP